VERWDVTPDERTFKRIMARFASGVTVVAVRGAAGFHGATVNAFGSVSLVPLVFVALESLSDTCLVVEEVGRFGVSVLGVAHEFLSERFAGRAPAVPPDFEGVAYHLSPGGQPILGGCLAWLDCRVRDVHEAGDHTLFVAEVEALGLGDDSEPLLYWAGRYRRIDPDPV
jgi:flavin reductase (DIM6/NTAB) family NADH-FMN oxidoreductase RutF